MLTCVRARRVDSKQRAGAEPAHGPGHGPRQHRRGPTKQGKYHLFVSIILRGEAHL